LPSALSIFSIYPWSNSHAFVALNTPNKLPDMHSIQLYYKSVPHKLGNGHLEKKTLKQML